MTTVALIEKLKESDQDHEFYPTTNEIIRALTRDIKHYSPNSYHYRDLKSLLDIGAGNGKGGVLFDVRGFKNGNMHLRLNQKFILALNVEHGSLKGWLNSPQEAAEELNEPEAASFFNSNLRLADGNPTLLLK